MPDGSRRRVLEEVPALGRLGAANLLDELDDRLEDALPDLFAGQDDMDIHIARLCEELGVAAPAGSEDAGAGSDAASTAVLL